jgi:hypothetical protein
MNENSLAPNYAKAMLEYQQQQIAKPWKPDPSRGSEWMQTQEGNARGDMRAEADANQTLARTDISKTDPFEYRKLMDAANPGLTRNNKIAKDIFANMDSYGVQADQRQLRNANEVNKTREQIDAERRARLLAAGQGAATVKYTNPGTGSSGLTSLA